MLNLTEGNQLMPLHAKCKLTKAISNVFLHWKEWVYGRSGYMGGVVKTITLEQLENCSDSFHISEFSS